ncbi:DNA cytosine methyltransferase [Lactiplantibacillus plantarum]|uniref:DNA cytosine methyltransferase n=1 Tax=Lactiplantibacillus plantarum TaxID=1590 RepID=UPI003CF9E7CE
MKFLDLFAGIGGFHLGMEQAGHQCVGWVEWDKFARQSYQAIHNVKGVWNASDIRTVRASELPRADCWCFGFPCQDISVAGKQKGFTAGKRSSLFFTVTGLIRDLEEEDRPSYLLIENVKNLLSINRGFDFLKLQIELDEIGYDVEWSVLDSAEVIPQHRERIFIVGHLRGRRTRKVFPIVRKNGETDKPDKIIKQIGNISDSKSFGSSPKVAVREATKIGYDVAKLGDSINFSQPNSKTRRGRVGHGVANTLTTGIEQATLTDDFKIRKLTPLECWRLQGFPYWAFDRAKQAGLSDSQLYKQAGNSVTVPVIKAIAEKMGLEDKL